MIFQRLRASLVATVLLLVVARAVSAVDFTGSWWLHPDPHSGTGGNSFTSVTFDVVQLDGSLAFSNVRARHDFATGEGTGVGTIDPITGAFNATFGYLVWFEPILTTLEGTVSMDALEFTGTADIRVGATPLLRGAVAGSRITGEPPVCGNDLLELGEGCDDGNLDSGDGCSDACVREPRCGDRIRDPGEDCDDGNRIDGDHCSAQCLREPRCGDGVPDPGEECDDGNTYEADRCSADCRSLQTCGNAIVEFSEGCDDGNTVDDDCCSNRCRSSSNVCRPSIAPCDLTELCSRGACPADSGIFDADADGVCNDEDVCWDMDGERAFLAPSRLLVTHINDGINDNERLVLRAVFDLPPSMPFDDYTPTAGSTIIKVMSARGYPVMEAGLSAYRYTGPGSRGWTHDPSRRQWLWREKSDAPFNDVILARITAVRTSSGDRVYVRVEARGNRHPFGLQPVLNADALPLQTSVTLGSFFYGQHGRCGQSRFAPTDCRMSRRGTRIVCE